LTDDGALSWFSYSSRKISRLLWDFYLL
jgi:hypothetical protein